MALAARICSLKEIFLQPKRLFVARYQRHYEWSLLQIEQLLSDLLSDFNQRGAGETNNDAYFLGSFIFQVFPRLREPDRIIDGQQRLVSLSIIFAVIRDLVQDPAQRAYLDNFLTIPEQPLEERPPENRLTLHRGDNNYFQTHIVPIGATSKLPKLDRPRGGTDKRMYENALRVRQWIIEEVGEDRYAEFALYVSTACRIIFITVDREDDAFKIFETVNNRGLPLREEDILREALIDFGTTDDSRRLKLLGQWDAMEQRMQQHWTSRFVAQLHMRRTKGRPTRKGLHRDIIESFASPEAALNFLEDEIDAQANAFHEIVAARITGIGQSATQRDINHRLMSMCLVDFDDWIAVAVAMFERYRADPEELLHWLAKLDRLVWFFYVRHSHKKIAENRFERFSKVLRHLIDHREFDAHQSGLELTGNDKGDMLRLLDAPISPMWIPLKSLLIRLESVYQKERWAVGQKLRRDLRHYTIEHILPLRPRNADGDYWFPRFDGAMNTLTQYAQALGNHGLVQRYVNRELGALPFPEKKAIMISADAHHDSYLVEDAVAQSEWTKEVIDQRTDAFLSKLRKEWDI